MKNLSSLLMLAAVLGVLPGCGSKKEAPPPAPKIGSVTVDTPKLLAAFEKSDPDTMNEASQVSYAVRYGDYMKAMAAADKLSNDPKLTPEQKKVVTDVMDQIKQVINSQGGAPPGQ